MIHQGQGLPLFFETRDDALGVHAEADDFQRDLAAHRLLLLGQINHAAPALAQALQQAVTADHHARADQRILAGGQRVRDRCVLRRSDVRPGGRARGSRAGTRIEGQENFRRFLRGQQAGEASPQGELVPAGTIQEGLALRRIDEADGLVEQAFLQLSGAAHR